MIVNGERGQQPTITGGDCQTYHQYRLLHSSFSKDWKRDCHGQSCPGQWQVVCEQWCRDIRGLINSGWCGNTIEGNGHQQRWHKNSRAGVIAMQPSVTGLLRSCFDCLNSLINSFWKLKTCLSWRRIVYMPCVHQYLHQGDTCMMLPVCFIKLISRGHQSVGWTAET